MSLSSPTELSFQHADSLPLIDADSIRSQLERITDSPHFRNSKRYPRFLKFIVDQTLAGNAEQLKERVVGIEVFDRVPDFDLASDPIVRVAAGEIRKRLAQYYIETGHENELRIQLHPGSYVPEFYWPHIPPPSEPIPSSVPAIPAQLSVPEIGLTPPHKHNLIITRFACDYSRRNLRAMHLSI